MEILFGSVAVFRTGVPQPLSVAKTQSDVQLQSLNDPTRVETWEGGAARNEIRSERLSAIVIEEESRNIALHAGA